MRKATYSVPKRTSIPRFSVTIAMVSFQMRRSREPLRSKRTSLHHANRECSFDHAARNPVQEPSEQAKRGFDSDARDTRTEGKQGCARWSANPRLRQLIFLRQKSDDVQTVIYARKPLRTPS